MGIMLVCAYLLGTKQVKTITEVQTVTEIKEIIPDNYILLDKCIPLEDVTEEYKNNFVDMRQVTDYAITENGSQLYFSDNSGYYWER